MSIIWSIIAPRLAFSADERAFLPAALEVMETPPNPLGRTLALTLCLAALGGIGWACFGKVGIVAVASGKFVSHGRTQVVQPFETASVAAILVEPGQSVRAGEALIELDKTAARAEFSRARSDGAIARLDVLRLQAFLDGATTAPFFEVKDAGDLERQRAQSQLTAQIAERAGKIASLRQEVAQKRAERQSLQQTADKIEKTIPMVAERSDIRTRAAAMGNVSVLAKLESQQLLVETRSEFEITRSKLVSLDAGIASVEQKILGAEAEMNASAMGEFFRARDRVSAARESLEKAQRRIDLQTLRAPIDGTVQQMHVATLGSVVTPAQQLLSIAPDDDQVEVEAVLENRDTGFVSKG
jgi:HlyD family secretion protein/hemolysin D